MADIQGTIDGETLNGTPDPDTINAGGGNDTVNADSGDDTVNGGDGHDLLRGNGGNDTINGDAGNDTLSGGPGNDLLNGGDGFDRASLYDDGTGGFGITVDLRLEGVAQDFGPLGIDTLTSIEYVNTTYNDDTVHGSDSRNWIWTYSGTDSLFGYGGDDLFTVGLGTKIIDGGAGSDTVEINDLAWVPAYTADGITVSLEQQQAQATGVGDWTLTGVENLSGNFGSDDFTGDGNANILAGVGGDDTLTGNGGDDILMGDGAMVFGNPHEQGTYAFIADLSPYGFGVVEGKDTLRGGAGNDTLYGGGNDDTLEGGGDNDTLYGGTGHDTLRGQLGNDALHGDAGNDFLIGGAGDDLLDGGDGIDRISLFDDGTGGFGITIDLRNTLTAQNFGPLGNDTVVGIEHVNTTYNNDTVNGNEAGNWIWTYSGFDQLWGHGGDDYFTVGQNDKVIDGGSGSDTVEIDDQAWVPAYTADGITVSLELQGQAQATGVGNWTLTGIENLSGNFGNDEFTGDGNANVLAGATGDDTLNGGGGDDTLMGDGAMVLGTPNETNTYSFIADLVAAGFTGIVEGNDTLNGGAGDDKLYGAGGNDILDGGADDDTLEGGAGDDQLTGGDGHDFMRGQAGNDTLNGGTGDDTLSGGVGNDIINGGDGIDRVSLFDDGTGGFGITVDLRIEGVAQDFGPLGSDTLTGIEYVNTTFNSDTVHGNEAGNWIWTYAGNDTLYGYGGDDLFTVGYGTKIIDGGAGSDTVEIDDDAWVPQYTQDGITVSLALQGTAQATGVGDWTLTGIENLSGNYGDDDFTGDDNANVLAGLGGNDTLTGAGGDDVLMGDGGMWIGLDPANPNAMQFSPDFLPTTFTITQGNDTLSGGAGNDTLYGAGGNDVLNGGDDNDTLDGGAGLDQLFGDAGDDKLIVKDAVVSTEVYNGGLGTDTLEFQAVPAFSPSTGYGITGASLSSIEQIRFGSTASIGVSVSMLMNQVTSSGLTTVIGGAGRDVFTVVATGPGGNFTTPNLTLSNWTNSVDPDFPGDLVVLFAAGNGAFTLNAREGLVANQVLVGANLNDTLNGSSGTDLLNGQGGVNVLNGNAGDDVLIIANNVNQQGFTTNYTGLGSSFNGGDGTDTLDIGGNVYFEGTLSSIEGIHLQNAIVSTQPNGAGGQGEAYLEMSLAQFAALPTDFYVDGTGTIDPDLDSGDSFDFSGVVFQPGSNVTFVFEGESEGAPVDVTWVGTSGRDIFDFGSDNTTVTGGAGVDTYEVDLDEEGPSLNAVITDFAPGEDKLDLSELGIGTVQRLADFVSQDGADVRFFGSSGGYTIDVLLQNTDIDDLDEEDFLLVDEDDTGPQVETGTEFADIQFGYAGNDDLHGAGGNDRLYTGGGTDQLFGDAGNDTLIVDGLFTGGTFNGGADLDTLELRVSDYNTFTAYGPITNYGFFQSTVTGIEQIRFASDDEAGVTGGMLMSQVVGSGLTTLIGGEGRDSMVVVGFSPTGGTFTMPNFTLVDWNSPLTPYNTGGDILILAAGSNAAHTLNAREGLASVQALVGSGGNDILNGSSGIDTLNGAGGANVLNGYDGNDVLVLVNVANPQGQVSTFTGLGSVFDGGNGMDTLTVGGFVDFQGTLVSIEQIHFQPALDTPLPNGAGDQAAAHLNLDAPTLPSLPANLQLSGTGTLTVNIGEETGYGGAAWTMAAGASVAVNIMASDGGDRIVLGSFAETVIDDIDGGVDTAVFAGNRADYVASAGLDGFVNIGSDSLKGVELFEFADGTFYWNGTTLVSAINEGLVADGYVAGATVYIDSNNNNRLDDGESFTVTDANGDFTLISPFTGALRAFGGTNIDTGLPNTVQFSATEGSTVINPLTTLVQTLIETGDAADEAAAQAAVKDAFGIDASIDLANVDLIAAATSDPALALTAHKAAASVAELLSIVNNAGGDSNAALLELTSVVAAGAPVDLTDTATLTQVVESGVAGGAPVSAADVVSVVQVGTQAISSATSVSEVSAAQDNALPVATGEAAAVNENATAAAANRASGVLGNDTDPDTGESALLRVTKAQGSGPAATTVAATGTTAVQGVYGTLQIAADGTYSYTANSAAAEALAGGQAVSDVFTYTVGDPKAEEATATLTFNVTGVDDAAVATNDANSVLENGTIAGASLVANDSDIDGPALAVTEVNGSAAGVGTQITLASGAKLTVTAGGTYSYDPNGAFNSLTAVTGASNASATDSFTYKLANGNTATATITVNGVASVGDQATGTSGNDALTGTGGSDSILGLAGNDAIQGGGGNDTLNGGTGNDAIDGGDGVDTAVFAGDRSAYTLTGNGASAVVTGPDGADALTSVEHLQFANGTYEFGYDGLSAERLFSATFGSEASAGGWSDNNTYPRMVADVDGDGRVDLVGFGSQGVYISLTQADGSSGTPFLAVNTFGAAASAGGWDDNNHYPRQFADVNGDGMSDLVGFGEAGTYVALATGGGSFGQAFLASDRYGASAASGGWDDNDHYPRMFADVNGDGKADLIGFGEAGTYVALGTGSGAFAAPVLASDRYGASAASGGWASNDLYTRTFGDVNGDGRDDLVGFGEAGAFVALAQGDGTFGPAFLASDRYGASAASGGWSSQNLYTRALGDMNGDGIADLVGFGGSGTYVAYGDGTGGFGPATLASDQFGGSAASGNWWTQNEFPRMLGDLNGDGAMDLIGFGRDGVHVATSEFDWVLV